MVREEKQKRDKKDGVYSTPVLFESRLRLLFDHGRQNHALVGYGKHGKYEDIQDLIC